MSKQGPSQSGRAGGRRVLPWPDPPCQAMVARPQDRHRQTTTDPLAPGARRSWARVGTAVATGPT